MILLLFFNLICFDIWIRLVHQIHYPPRLLNLPINLLMTDMHPPSEVHQLILNGIFRFGAIIAREYSLSLPLQHACSFPEYLRASVQSTLSRIQAALDLHVCLHPLLHLQPVLFTIFQIFVNLLFDCVFDCSMIIDVGIRFWLNEFPLDEAIHEIIKLLAHCLSFLFWFGNSFQGASTCFICCGSNLLQLRLLAGSNRAQWSIKGFLLIQYLRLHTLHYFFLQAGEGLCFCFISYLIDFLIDLLHIIIHSLFKVSQFLLRLKIYFSGGIKLTLQDT